MEFANDWRYLTEKHPPGGKGDDMNVELFARTVYGSHMNIYPPDSNGMYALKSTIQKVHSGATSEQVNTLAQIFGYQPSDIRTWSSGRSKIRLRDSPKGNLEPSGIYQDPYPFSGSESFAEYIAFATRIRRECTRSSNFEHQNNMILSLKCNLKGEAKYLAARYVVGWENFRAPDGSFVREPWFDPQGFYILYWWQLLDILDLVYNSADKSGRELAAWRKVLLKS